MLRLGGTAHAPNRHLAPRRGSRRPRAGRGRGRAARGGHACRRRTLDHGRPGSGGGVGGGCASAPGSGDLRGAHLLRRGLPAARGLAAYPRAGAGSVVRDVPARHLDRRARRRGRRRRLGGARLRSRPGGAPARGAHEGDPGFAARGRRGVPRRAGRAARRRADARTGGLRGRAGRACGRGLRRPRCPVRAPELAGRRRARPSPQSAGSLLRDLPGRASGRAGVHPRGARSGARRGLSPVPGGCLVPGRALDGARGERRHLGLPERAPARPGDPHSPGRPGSRLERGWGCEFLLNQGAPRPPPAFERTAENRTRVAWTVATS